MLGGTRLMLDGESWGRIEYWIKRALAAEKRLRELEREMAERVSGRPEKETE